MKIVCISDLHEQWENVKIPECDILINAGDMTYQGNINKLKEFNEWMGKQPAKYKISIAGNHDETLDTTSKYQTHGELQIAIAEEVKKLFTNFIYLEDQLIEIEGLKIYGSPWSNRFFDWGFNAEEFELEEIYSKIPQCDILISHGPPFGIGDLNPNYQHCGSQALLNKISNIKPKLVVCGHIHYSYGVYRTIPSLTVVNASICTEQYKPINTPIEIEI